MSQTVVIYHRADWDGLFCRAIAEKFLTSDTIFIGWDYGDPTPGKSEINGTEDLYMLDISVADLMDHPRLVWIDHHKTAIEKFDAAIHGYRIDGVAACRLAWQYFTCEHGPHNPHCHPADYRLPEKQAYIDRAVSEPLAVQLAGEYDIWDKRDPRAELFQHGLRSQELTENLWDLLLVPQEPAVDGNKDVGTIAVESLLERGEALQYFQAHQNESVINELGFTFEWEGLTWLACNHARYNSFLFTAGIKPEHDACFGFKWTGKDWSVSLYHAPGKEHHDLSLIAVKNGGGGHRGACGFRTSSLPFLK